MDILTFVNLAKRSEREALEEFADTSVAYLRKIHTTKNASNSKAYLIEQGTIRLAAKNRLLEKVPGTTLVKDEAKYLAFVRKLPKQPTTASTEARA